MMTGILIAIAAGAASALMFASLISGTAISVMLMYLAPLPLLVAALGWGPVTAAIGGVAASLALGAMIGWAFMLAFAVWAAIPALWLGYLLLLGRPAETPDGPTSGAANALEWYPIGRVLMWIAAFAAAITIVGLLNFGTDAETIKSRLSAGLSRMFNARSGTSEIGAMLALIAPTVSALGTMVVLTLNVWLAAKIVNMSGRLRRPWPDLKATALPPMTMVALPAAIAFCFTGGLLAIAAQVVSAVIMTAYAMTGFATLHTVTLALKGRGLWLSFAYLTVTLFVWPIVLMTIVGLADAVFGFRQRFMRSHNPAVPS